MSVSDDLILPPLCKGRGTAFQGYEAVVGLQQGCKSRLGDCRLPSKQCAVHITTSQFLNVQKGERSKTAPLTQGSRKNRALHNE
jgi:hypothetical protein